MIAEVLRKQKHDQQAHAAVMETSGPRRDDTTITAYSTRLRAVAAMLRLKSDASQGSFPGVVPCAM